VNVDGEDAQNVRAKIPAVSEQKSTIAANLASVRERMARAADRAGRRIDTVTLVAVSKRFPADAIREAHALGICHFGENRVQEWEGKRAHLAGLQGVWHFIGHLQANKARKAVHLFDRIDGVDDAELARKLDATAAAEQKRLPVLIEVHLGGEASKSGVSEAELPALAAAVRSLEHIELSGLMTIPPYCENPEDARPYFRRLRELRDELSRQAATTLPILSMGMSHDFETAIEEGATEIRVGTALFGGRN
jgi:pyridoxal phosphate enzyme (YggS family)